MFARYRRKGYASRALELLIRHLNDSTAIHTATLLIHPDNVPALAVATRSGFRPSGDIAGSRYFTRRTQE